MLGVKEIIQEAQTLPVEERAMVIDSLIRSLNSADTSVEEKWIALAKNRLNDLRAGRVTAVPGEQVFARIREALHV